MGIPRNLSNLAPGASSTGVLDVTKGGTGSATLAANNVLLGNGTSALQAVSPGTSGNVLTSNGTTWTSASAPASSGVVTATASGAITSGKPVIINADGTVTQVGVSFNNNATLQTQTTPSFSADNRAYALVYHSGIDRFIAFSYNAGGTLNASIGNLVGNSVTYTFVSTVASSGDTRQPTAVYIPGIARVALASWDNGTLNLRLYSATTTTLTNVAGISIPFSSFPYGLSLVYDSFNNRLLLSFSDNAGVKCFVVNATASSLTAGSVQTVSDTNFTASAILAVDCSTDGRILFSYNNSSSGTTVGKAASLSDLTLTFGSETTLFASTSDARYVVYIPSVDRFLCTRGSEWKLAQVSGTTITAGSNISGGVAPPDQQNNFYVVKPFVYNSATQGLTLYGTSDVIVGTFTTSAFTAVATLSIGSTQPNQRIQIAFDSTETKIAVAGVNFNADAARSTVITFPSSTNLTATNYLGLSAGTYTNGQTATIQIDGSVNTAQSGLTIGSSYYVQTDGTLSATPASPKVFAGFATTATNIAIENPTFGALSPITSTGDLIIGDGTNSATRLAIGTNGQILQSNGTTATWVASSSPYTLISTTNVAGATTVDFNNLTASAYSGGYMLVLNDVLPASNAQFTMQYFESGSLYTSFQIRYSAVNLLPDSGSIIGQSNQDRVYIAGYTYNVANDYAGAGVSGTINFQILTNKNSPIVSDLYFIDSSTAAGNRMITQSFVQKTSYFALTGIRLRFTSGTMSSGTIRLYGVNL